jgi:hypothetical protein
LHSHKIIGYLINQTIKHKSTSFINNQSRKKHMQTIRTLRAQSRPASPAPGSLEGSHMPFVIGSNGGKPVTEDMHQQPQRPNSAMSRIQSLTPFQKRLVFTPPPSPRPTSAVVVAPSAIVQDGMYLDTLGLKLNEAATRVLVATPGDSGADVWKGKKPLQTGRGRQFASLVATWVALFFVLWTEFSEMFYFFQWTGRFPT